MKRSDAILAVVALIAAALAVCLALGLAQPERGRAGNETSTTDPQAPDPAAAHLAAERTTVPTGTAGPATNIETFAVRCVDAEGVAVPGARIEVRHGTEKRIHVAQSDADGRFEGRFEGAGVSLQVSHPARGSASIVLSRRRDAGVERTVVLTPFATLEVEVVDAGSHPLPGARVALLVRGVQVGQGLHPAAPEPKWTDASGLALFRIEARGAYSVQAESAAGHKSAPRHFQALAGGLERIVLSCGEPFRIHGVVQEADGAPIGGAFVKTFLAEGVYMGESLMATTTSDALGRFTLSVAHTGNHVLLAIAKGYALERLVPVKVRRDDENGSPLILTMHRSGSVTGRVVDATGRPCAGCMVIGQPVMGGGRGYPANDVDSLFMVEDSGRVRTGRTANGAKTDQNGNFTLPLTPWVTGSWVLRARGVSGSGDLVQGELHLDVPQSGGPAVVQVAALPGRGIPWAIHLDGVGGTVRAWRCERRHGVWMGTWAPLEWDDKARALRVPSEVEVLDDAIAVVGDGGATFLVDSSLANAIRTGRTALSPSHEVTVVAVDGTDRTSASLVSGSRWAFVGHPAGFPLTPEVLRVDASRDPGVGMLPAGDYLVGIAYGYQTMARQSVSIPESATTVEITVR